MQGKRLALDVAGGVLVLQGALGLQGVVGNQGDVQCVVCLQGVLGVQGIGREGVSILRWGDVGSGGD